MNFGLLTFERVKSLMNKPIMVDLRNIYNPDEMVEAGFDYHCVGRKCFQRTLVDKYIRYGLT